MIVDWNSIKHELRNTKTCASISDYGTVAISTRIDVFSRLGTSLVALEGTRRYYVS